MWVKSTWLADELECRRSLWRDRGSEGTILAQFIESSRGGSKLRIQDLEYVEGNGLAQPHLQGELTSSFSACRHPWQTYWIDFWIHLGFARCFLCLWVPSFSRVKSGRRLIILRCQQIDTSLSRWVFTLHLPTLNRSWVTNSQNDELGRGPLASYFKGEHLAGHDADLTTSNMYLAEDRILCWELVAKRGDAWILKYVKSATGETVRSRSLRILLATQWADVIVSSNAQDVPDTVAEFINQRRRWLNGSFFASTYALTHTMQLFGTQHSRRQVFFLLIQAIYNLCQVVFAWFGLGNYAIFFFLSWRSPVWAGGSRTHPDCRI